jgi:transcriptional regulator with XRE-family HTH domain
MFGDFYYIRKLSHRQLLERRKMSETLENKSFAYQKFKSLCEQNNMTPYQVSIKSGNEISTTVLTQWKNGEYDLKLKKLKILAEVFNVPVTEFIEN